MGPLSRLRPNLSPRMKSSLIAAAITGVLAAGAGVAIAGLPSTPPGDGLVITALPPTTSTIVPVVADTVAALPTTTTTTPAPASTEPEPAGTTSPDTTTTTTEPEAAPLVERADLDVATVNAAGVGGVATSTASVLDGLGYTEVQPADAVAVSEVSIVYHVPELAAEAARLADDLGWPTDRLAPIAELPAITAIGTFDLVAFIGTDVAPPPEEP